MKPDRLFIVDAFTSQRFKGNPAGVCLLKNGADVQWMQNIASELNLSETAFCFPGNSIYQLRWFTPTREVDLCGHATLATAHILFETRICQSNHIEFQTLSGRLTATMTDAGKIELDFPSEVPSSVDITKETLNSLGLSPIKIAANRLDVLMQLAAEKDVIEFSPDFDAVRTLNYRGLIVTARSDSDQYDIVSRCFYPAYGIDEDPVTGSAHCALSPYWSEILGKTELAAYQASARGGSLYLKLQEDRVMISGEAVTFCEIILS